MIRRPVQREGQAFVDYQKPAHLVYTFAFLPYFGYFSGTALFFPTVLGTSSGRGVGE